MKILIKQNKNLKKEKIKYFEKRKKLKLNRNLCLYLHIVIK